MTSLIGGQRVAKNSPRVSAYGTLDELNAMIGLVQAHCTELDNFVTATLLSINNTLFNIGAYLATPSPQTDSQPEAPAGDTPGPIPRAGVSRPTALPKNHSHAHPCPHRA